MIMEIKLCKDCVNVIEGSNCIQYVDPINGDPLECELARMPIFNAALCGYEEARGWEAKAGEGERCQ